MELPVCHGIYSNEHAAEDANFLNGVIQFLDDHKQEYRSFFVGICYYCNAMNDLDGPLQRCGGCQLVGYCSRDCQKNDWNSHKAMCKEFPLVKGKNVMWFKGSWVKHITGLCERAARLPEAIHIFRNPRVCNTCREPRPERLTDCYTCQCVSYCSKRCNKADKMHTNDCASLSWISMAQFSLYHKPVQDVEDSSIINKAIQETRRKFFENAFSALGHDPNQELKLKTPMDNYMMAESVRSEFIPMSDFSGLSYPLLAYVDDRNDNEMTSTHRKFGNHSISHKLLSYPLSLLYALQSLPQRRLGQDHRPLEDLTTLDVHVVASSPLFHSEPWELFVHQLPNLKNLNIVFVMQGKAFNQSFNLNSLVKTKLRRCEDCEAKDRIITYSVKQMHYHMFFSSQEYARPDVVVVYGNSHEMSTEKSLDVHSEISYSNMTYSRDTILVLMDTTKGLVTYGVKAVNASRPVNQVVIPQINKLSGMRLERAKFGSEAASITDNHYFTCLRQK